MSLLFSNVSLTSKSKTIDFLVRGIPIDKEDLLGYSAFKEYLASFKNHSEINAHVSSYLYGEGEISIATIEEVAYMKLRTDKDSNFLSQHCTKMAESDFSFYPQFGNQLKIAMNIIQL